MTSLMVEAGFADAKELSVRKTFSGRSRTFAPSVLRRDNAGWPLENVDLKRGEDE